MEEVNERRTRQRVVVDQEGRDDFQLEFDGHPVTVRDVSIDGFAMVAATAPDAHRPVAFRLTHQQLPGVVSGRAQVVNFVHGPTPGGGIAGCRIVDMGEDGHDTLVRWLSHHVVAVASVPLSEDEARKIVDGPSLV
jgi:hypothetical protein